MTIKTFKETFKETCNGVPEYWSNIMPIAAMEEDAEFIRGVSRYERHLAGKASGDNARQELIDEIEDLYSSITALMLQYNATEDDDTFYNDVKKRIEEKLNKKY